MHTPANLLHRYRYHCLYDSSSKPHPWVEPENALLQLICHQSTKPSDIQNTDWLRPCTVPRSRYITRLPQIIPGPPYLSLMRSTRYTVSQDNQVNAMLLRYTAARRQMSPSVLLILLWSGGTESARPESFDPSSGKRNMQRGRPRLPITGFQICHRFGIRKLLSGPWGIILQGLGLAAVDNVALIRQWG